MFWPYAYHDVVYYTWFPYPADEPFWGYGYPEIWYGIFSPESYRSETVIAGETSRGAMRRRTRDVAVTGAIAPEQLGPLCGEDSREVANWPIDNIQDVVKPTSEQQAALDALGDASVKAAQVIKTACPSEVALTPAGRLAAIEQRLVATAEAIAIVREPLARFYGLLDDEQKARLNEVADRVKPETARARSLARPCGEVPSSVGRWPMADIERALAPTPPQQEKLNALVSAADQAAEAIKASCPAAMPVTPPARLDAVAHRIDVMQAAVRSVRNALDAFYGSLSDEQKARFNTIGRARARTAQARSR